MLAPSTRHDLIKNAGRFIAAAVAVLAELENEEDAEVIEAKAGLAYQHLEDAGTSVLSIEFDHLSDMVAWCGVPADDMPELWVATR